MTNGLSQPAIVLSFAFMPDIEFRPITTKMVSAGDCRLIKNAERDSLTRGPACRSH